MWVSGLDERFERGLVPPQAVYDELRAALGTPATDDELRQAWSCAFGPDLGVMAVVGLTQSPRYLFTNNGPVLSDYLHIELNGVADLFDDSICSWHLGQRKPEREAFEALLVKLRVKPNEVVFVDDSPDNVESARAVGIDAVRFASADGLRHELEPAPLREIDSAEFGTPTHLHEYAGDGCPHGPNTTWTILAFELTEARATRPGSVTYDQPTDAPSTTSALAPATRSSDNARS